MPVAPQGSSFFSSIRQVFHSSAHLHPSAVAPDPSTPSSSSSSSSSFSNPHHLQLYNTFESNVTHRLSLLSPLEHCACVNMASLKEFLQVLLDMQTDFMSLIPSYQYPLSKVQIGMMDEFLDRSIKMLDVCRGIKEQILDVQSSQGMLQLVISCFSPQNGGVLRVGQVARGRKVLAEMQLHGEGDEGVTAPVCLSRSLRFRCRSLGLDAPKQWRPWQGNTWSSAPLNTSTLGLSRQLQAIGDALTIPKLAAGDAEENLCAAIYTVNVLSVFFLGTLSASLPSASQTYVARFAHPRFFSWASPLAYLEEKVQEELKLRANKSNRYVGMWELDQIAIIAKRLFELTEGEDVPLGDKAREEIKNLVKQLWQHVEEVERGMELLYTQLMDFYHRIISSRMKILDILCKFKP